VPFNNLSARVKAWVPYEDDKYGDDKKHFLEFLHNNCIGVDNALAIKKIIGQLSSLFTNKYTKESFQMHIVASLRKERQFFIGTCSKGIFLVDKPEDAEATYDFYSTRIRSELFHLRNLKHQAKKYSLFADYKGKQKKNKKICDIYFDESGTPDLNHEDEFPYFIVTGVVFDGKRRETAFLDKKFDHLRNILGKPKEYEFKSNGINSKDYEVVMRELGTVDFEIGSLIFDKSKFCSSGKTPKGFYQFAFQVLIEKLLEFSGQVNLFFDEYSGAESLFQKELEKYIREENSCYPANKIDNLVAVKSEKSSFIQLADLVCGVIKNKLKGRSDLLHLIEDRFIVYHTIP